MKMFKLGLGALILTLVVSLAFLACDTGSTTTTTPPPQPLGADIVVVGGGLAGLSAAISAVQEGASVILVERFAFTGGASATSGGGIAAAETSVQANASPPVTATIAAWRAHFAMRQGSIAPASLRNTNFPIVAATDFMTAQAGPFIEWMVGMDFPFGAPWFFGRDLDLRLHSGVAPYNGGGGLMTFFRNQAEDAGVTIMLNALAVEVLQESGPGSAVTGVRLQNGTVINAQAVILAGGGFAANLQEFLPNVNFPVTGGHAGSDGSAINMAVAAGGELHDDPWIKGVGLAAAVGNLNAAASLIENPPANQTIVGGASPNSTAMFVNQRTGARVVHETHHYSILTGAAFYAGLQGDTLFAIFDSRISRPTAAQLANAELFYADTIAELATLAGIHADLAATVTAWNAFSYPADDPLNNELFDLDHHFPITQAPFFAVRLVPTIMGTFGGVRTIFTTGAVLANGSDTVTIPGLFAAGETASRAFYDKVYVAGTGLAQAGTTGRAAGLAAAAFVAP
jgi:fumarate reductase flavoprotein subunit